MNKNLHEEIFKKAFFVAGSNSRFRDKNDTLAISAISDAEEFLKTLPSALEKPYITAGTTADPDRIVSFTWTYFAQGSLKSVYVSCIGNGLYDASWNNLDNSDHSLTSINLPELIKLNVAQKISVLKSHDSISKPSLP